jgi:hypothetical protein
VPAASVEFGDGRLSSAWRDLEIREQEGPQGIHAVEEMSTRAARDEYQPVTIPGPEDVNTTRHGRTPKSNVDLPLRLARLPQYDSVGSSAHWPMGPPGAMIDPRRAAPSFHPFGGLAGEMDVAGL